jgi:hypothetical protein
MKPLDHLRYFQFDGYDFKIERCAEGSAASLGHGDRQNARSVPLAATATQMREWRLYQRDSNARVYFGDPWRAIVPCMRCYLPNAQGFDAALHKLLGSDARAILEIGGSIE